MNNDFQDYATPSSAANSLVLQNFIESQCFSHKTQSSFAPLPPMPSGTGDTIHAPANNARQGQKYPSDDFRIFSRGSVFVFLSIDSQRIEGMLLAAHSFDSKNLLRTALA